jgi:hypothetical protein
MARTKKPSDGNPAPAVTTEVSLRRDLYVYNEATAFLITSPAAKGLNIEPGEPIWGKRYARGEFIPVELYQDDSFIMRVVLNESLTQQESDEWVGKITFKLSIPDGTMVVTGGTEYICETSEWTEEHLVNFLQTIAVPPGDYQLDLYTYITAANGSPLVELAEQGKEEPTGTYFRRTRKVGADKFPEWLRKWCIGHHSTDPQHLDEWKDVPYPDDNTLYADFLAHLIPLAKTKLTNPPLVEEFISWNEMQCRKPDKCPLGLISEKPQGWKDPSEYQPPAPEYNFVDVWAAMNDPEWEPQPLTGGSVVLNQGKMHHLYIVARAANGKVSTEFVLRGKSCTQWAEALRQIAPEQLHVSEDAGGKAVHLRLAENESRFGTLGLARQAGAALAKLKLDEGDTIEVVCAEAARGQVLNLAGMTRFRAVVTNGALHVSDAYPQVDVQHMKHAVTMADQCEDETISLLSVDNKQAAAQAINFWKAQWEPIFRNNVPVLAEGGIVFKEGEQTAKHLMLEEYFVQAYGKVWAVREPDEDASKKVLRQTAIESGELLLDAGDRKFLAAPLEAISDDAVREELANLDADLLRMGAHYIGMLTCTQFKNVVFAYYLMPDKISRLVWYQVGYTPSMTEIITDFTDGASLSTMRQGGPTSDEPDKKIFRSRYPKAPLGELYQRHQERTNELAKSHGEPVVFSPSLKLCAEKFNESIKKQ